MSGPDPHAIDPTPFTQVPGRARRRSEALAALSREHHRALAQAMALKRAGEETAEPVWRSFLAFWRHEGSEHFVEEEGVLLPAYAGTADPAHPAVVRTVVEHLLIRAKINELARQERRTPSQLQLLGEWLTLHVRLEERVLFPLIEDALGERGLEELTQSHDS